MTATNIYLSTTTPNMDRPYTASGSPAAGSINQGYDVGVTEPEAADFMSLRLMVYSTGTTATNITKKDVEDFLDICRNWLYNSTGIDVVAGSETAVGNGLDYVLKVNSIAQGIP